MSKPCKIDIDIEPNIWIQGDERSVMFQKVFSVYEKDNSIELTWEQITKLVFAYKHQLEENV